MNSNQDTTKETQVEFVVRTLLSTGEISRNFCLRNYISRLGAIMNNLKKVGWDFTTERRGGDYVYKLKTKDTLF